MSESSATICLVNILIKTLLGVSLKAIWSVINTLQIICYLPKIKANLAPQGTIVLDELRKIAFLEFIPYKWMTDEIKSLF